MIQGVIQQLVDGEDLDRATARGTMDQIMSGGATDAQIGAFLMALRCKGETVAEVAGFAEAMREKATPIGGGTEPMVDTCGTGGDGSGTFNISTTVAFVAAGAEPALARAGRFGDGWFTMARDPQQFSDLRRKVDAYAREAGREGQADRNDQVDQGTVADRIGSAILDEYPLVVASGDRDERRRRENEHRGRANGSDFIGDTDHRRSDPDVDRRDRGEQQRDRGHGAQDQRNLPQPAVHVAIDGEAGHDLTQAEEGREQGDGEAENDGIGSQGQDWVI